jgi:hypothetical protein
MIRKRLSGRQVRIFIAAGLVAFLTVGGTATASAYWTAAAAPIGGTAKSLNTQVDLGDASVLDTTFKFTGTNAPITIKSISVANSGTTPVTYTLTTSAIAGTASLGSSIKVWDWAVAAGAACGSTVPAGSNAGTLASLPALPTKTAAAGTSYNLCLATQLTTTVAASQGLTVTEQFTLTGTVGDNWTSTDTSSTKQTVFQIGSLTSLTCANRPASDGYGVTLTWPIVAGATSYAAYANGSTTSFGSVTQPTTGTTASIRLNYEEDSSSFVIGNATTVKIVPIDGTYGTTGAGLSQTLHSANVLLFFTTLQCN